jgi:hypothetical protein
MRVEAPPVGPHEATYSEPSTSFASDRGCGRFLVGTHSAQNPHIIANLETAVKSVFYPKGVA